MSREELFRAFAYVDDDILERSEAPAPRRRRLTPRGWGALAACLALALGLTCFAVAAEAREYGEAVEFFADNGLSAEGLSRADVKAVYRDITTRRFTYGKTAEVIERAVPGWEIDQQEPTEERWKFPADQSNVSVSVTVPDSSPGLTPEELAALWSRNMSRNAGPKAGVSYQVDCLEKMDGTLGFDVLDKSVLACYRDGELLWTAEFPGLMVFSDEVLDTSSGTAVWGHNDTWSSEQPVYASVARVDGSGNILWQKQLDHGFEREYISQVVDNADGTWAVVSRGDFEYLCLSQYDMDGNELSFSSTEAGNYGIWNVVRLGDGYLAQLGNSADGETARVVRLDRAGNVLDTFTYEGEDCDYIIKDMIGFGGRVYLSACAVPKQTGEGGRYEIAGVLAYLFDNDIREISSEELTPMLRDNYTAVLLLCGSEGGAPETFYSVKGSLGGKLAVNDAGELEWDAESVVYSFFSPMTNAYTIGGTCQVFRYTFDAAGNLVRREDTGETAPYYR